MRTVAVLMTWLLGTLAHAQVQHPARILFHGRPAVQIPLVAQPPRMDGIINEAIWSQASILTLDTFNSGEQGLHNTSEARILSTRTALYLAVRCFDTDPTHTVGALHTRDTPLWDDDTVELYLKPEKDSESPYAQIVINAKGAIFDAYAHVAPACMPT